jgi:hypothetical protein
MSRISITMDLYSPVSMLSNHMEADHPMPLFQAACQLSVKESAVSPQQPTINIVKESDLVANI